MPDLWPRANATAKSYDPIKSFQVRYVTYRGECDGEKLAKAHHPYAVVEDRAELSKVASRECDTWWSGLIETEAVKPRYPEVKRLYSVGFIAGYLKVTEDARKAEERKRVREEEERQEEERRKRRAQEEAERAKGARVEIKNRRALQDGVLYVIHFLDPDRMTRDVSFGVSVKDDGTVELEEI